VVEIAPPAAWSFGPPPPEQAIDALIADAETVARWAAPDVILPFPEPDGLGSLLLGVRTPQEWRGFYELAARRLTAIAPHVRLAVRLMGTGERSRALFEALAAQPRPSPSPARACRPARRDGGPRR
jgi:hypothetical protein